MSSFLSIYTPTFKRPQLLADCIASVASQSEPCQHVLVHDTVGLGVGGMYKDIRNHAWKCTGDYIYVLQDDDVLVDSEVARDLRTWIEASPKRPAVLMVRNQKGHHGILPHSWESEPRHGHVDLGSFLLRLDVWLEMAGWWRDFYHGDFLMLRGLWDEGRTFGWCPRLVARSQWIGAGQPESARP